MLPARVPSLESRLQAVPVPKPPAGGTPAKAGNERWAGLPGGDPFLVPGRPRRLGEIADGTSNTILVVEAADGVNWAKPDDVRYDPARLPKVGAPGRKWFFAAMGDGSVRTFDRSKLTDEQFKAWLTVNGGEVVNFDTK